MSGTLVMNSTFWLIITVLIINLSISLQSNNSFNIISQFGWNIFFIDLSDSILLSADSVLFLLYGFPLSRYNRLLIHCLIIIKNTCDPHESDDNNKIVDFIFSIILFTNSMISLFVTCRLFAFSSSLYFLFVVSPVLRYLYINEKTVCITCDALG